MKWLACALLLLLTGAAFQLGLLVYAMYVMLIVLMVSRFLARSWIENLSAHRDLSSDRAEIGDTLRVTVTIQNQGTLSIPWLLLEESLPVDALVQKPPRLRARGARISLISVPAEDEESFEYQVEFLARGYYQIGPLLLESGDLFGLHRRYRVAAEPQFILVPPKVVPLDGYNLASRQPMGEIRMSYRLFEDPTRICGIRAYERGDSLNRIHWPATARTGVLQSKVFEPSSVAGATILLDFHQESHRGHNANARTELAVTVAASLASAVHQLGQRIGFITNGRDATDRIREDGWNQEFRVRKIAREKTGMRDQSDRLRPIIVETQRATEQLDRILDTLARVELTDGLSFSDLVLETASRLPRNATVIAVLPEVPPEVAVALSDLRRRGYSVIAVTVVFDTPRTPDWARRPDWADWLISSGIEIRRIDSEAALSSLCSELLCR